MNQMTQILKESNRRMRLLINHKITLDDAQAQRAEGELQLKVVNAAIAAFGVDSKNRRTERTIAGMDKMNLLDEHTAVDLGLGDMEVDKIKCPERGIIIRQECLDFSGEKKNYDVCKECEHYEITRKELLTD